jgi:hypothetical protein
MDIRLASALNYYGFKNLKQAKEHFGLYQDVDIKRFLLECYTEDTIKDGLRNWATEIIEQMEAKHAEEQTYQEG